MEVAFSYSKKRHEFGHHCVFEDVPAQILESIAPTSDYDAEYLPRNPQFTTLDTTPIMSEHDVNTDRVLYKNQGMRHFEGAWPENVDGTEADQVDRYLKKHNKDPKFKTTVAALGGIIETAVKQNNTIDIYEEYFAGVDLDLSSEPPSARGLAVFRDPSPLKRTATNINWHPEGTRIAVAYSVLRFQDERVISHRMPSTSYIWDISNPNLPVVELCPLSPLVSLRYNVKSPDILAGGSYNGLVSVFDVRKPRAVAMHSSSIEKSHHDPVYDVFWIQSKTNNQFVSVSTDGQMLWWDTRRLAEPTDVVQLTDGSPSGRLLGGTSLEYNIEAGPAKYLVGTEQGVVLSLNMRKKQGGGDKGPASNAGLVQAQDMGAGKHHGPIYAIHRNPTHPNNYMTVGDWGVRIWSEKNKSPILTTPYSKSYLMAGCWSPTRPGVFYTARQDGVVEVWDIYYRQSSPVYSHKVADCALSSISVQGSPSGGGGRLVAAGDVNGTVTLLEVSESLAALQHNEKNAVGAMFDRESRREENLEKRAQALARAARAAAGAAKPAGDAAAEEGSGDGEDPAMEETLRRVDAEFAALLRQADAEGGAVAAGGAGGAAAARGDVAEGEGEREGGAE